jgi:hypothetical protein
MKNIINYFWKSHIKIQYSWIFQKKIYLPLKKNIYLKISTFIQIIISVKVAMVLLSRVLKIVSTCNCFKKLWTWRTSWNGPYLCHIYHLGCNHHECNLNILDLTFKPMHNWSKGEREREEKKHTHIHTHTHTHTHTQNPLTINLENWSHG